MRSPASSPAMIGREADLVALRAELSLSLRGVPRGVVIGGEAGIGKTRLVDEFRAEASEGAFVLVGRCVDLGSDSAPYGPITAVLRALTLALDQTVRGEDEPTGSGTAALLEAAGPGRDGLGVLLPELASTDSSAQRIGAERLYEVVTVLLENVSREHPLVIVIEDIHWADTATLDLLRFLLRMLGEGRILFVLSYRSDEVLRGHPLRSYLPEFERTRSVVRWELARLSREQVAAQVRAILGWAVDATTLERIYERSEGVPFFVEELIGLDNPSDEGDLPETLRDLLLARYERLSEPTQRILRLISAGGSCVDHALLEVVHTGSPEELDAAAREAVLANVLTTDEREYSFRHALVREAVLADLLPGERTRFHTRYAEALESGVAGSRVAGKISYHRMAAHDLSKAFPVTLAAMSEARSAYAYGTAARLGERALELWDRVSHAEAIAERSHVDLLAQTASALRNAGEGERALALVNVALQECPSSDVTRYARLLRDKALYLANLSRVGSTQTLRDAIEMLAKEEPSALRALVTGELAGRLMLEARYDEAVEAATIALDEARAVGSSKRMSIASNIRGVSLIGHGDIDEGLADLERARELADGDDGALLRYRVNASDVMYLLGRYDEAVEIAEAGARRARELGVERTSGVMLASNTIEPLLAIGEWKRASALLEAALALDPPPGFRFHLQRMKLWSTLVMGDPSGADELLRSWRSAMAVQAEIEMQSRLGIARIAAEIALAQGDVERAWGEASVIITDAHRSMPAYDLPLLVVAARILARRRERGDADDTTAQEALLRRILQQSALWPTAVLWNTLFEAELSGSDHAGTDAAAWQRAAEVACDSTAPVHLAPYALYRLAQAQVAHGDRRAAQQNAVIARHRAREIGVGLVVGMVDALAKRAGLELDGTKSARSVSQEAAETGEIGRLQRQAFRLTERETQVLDLIGQGLSNRQIGEQLFISAKTASVHVSAILKKVGASTRTEAVYLASQNAVERAAP